MLDKKKKQGVSYLDYVLSLGESNLINSYKNSFLFIEAELDKKSDEEGLGQIISYFLKNYNHFAPNDLKRFCGLCLTPIRFRMMFVDIARTFEIAFKCSDWFIYNTDSSDPSDGFRVLLRFIQYAKKFTLKASAEPKNNFYKDKHEISLSHILSQGQSIVYEGYYGTEKVIIKKTPKNLIGSDHEIQVYEKLKDVKGIGKLIEFRHDEEHYLLIFQYSDSANLREIVDIFGPLQFKQVWDISITVKEILQNIHKKGVIHCDIKPENILISGSVGIQIIDFDGAYFNNQPGFKSTLNFASVDEMIGFVKPRPKDDLESYIYTCVFMLTGNLPWFKSTNELEIIQKKLEYIDNTIPNDSQLHQLWNFIMN